MAITDEINCACTDVTGFETLATLRSRLALEMGYGAHATLPPHMASLFDSRLQTAQRLAYARLLKAGMRDRFFSWPLTADVALYDLPDNAERDTIATPVISSTSTNAAGGTLAAATYYYRVSAINAFGETLASTEASRTTAGATSSVTINWSAITGATGYKVYGRSTGAELLIATVGEVLTYEDTGAVTPAGALPTANTTYTCNKTFNPRAILRVFTVTDGVERELIPGIPRGVIGSDLSGPPTHYELLQCFRLWPPPSETNGELVVRAHANIEAFTEDSDTTSIDSELVFLLALANCKAAAGKPDAGNYMSYFEGYLREMVAGSHGTRRYIPGRRSDVVREPDPVPTVPFP